MVHKFWQGNIDNFPYENQYCKFAPYSLVLLPRKDEHAVAIQHSFKP